MPISLAIIACGCGLFYFGALGFSKKGIRLSPKKTLVGTSGKVVGIFCFIFGAVLCIVGLGLIVLIVARGSNR